MLNTLNGERDTLKRASPYAHLTKLIYISRLQTNVTADKITCYIKTKVPDLDEKNILLRMLVKKDQNLEELTFISFRLSCTEELYTKLIDSSFWPHHVMIGEFIERERKQNNLGDFIVTKPPQNELGYPNANSSKNIQETNVIDIKDDESDMETGQ